MISRNLVSAQPPAFRAVPIWQYKRRFVATGAVSGNCLISSILGSAFVATTAILGNSLLDSVRIKSVRCWAPVQTQGQSVTIVLTPIGIDASNNCFNDLPSSITDTSVSFDRPAYVSIQPSVDTPIGAWHTSTTISTNLFNLVAPLGTVVDITFEGVLNFASPPLGFTQAIVGGTAGTIYCRSLIANLVPVGVNTI